MKIARTPGPLSIRDVLTALDNRLIPTENFGGEGEAGQVLTSAGPEAAPAYKHLGSGWQTPTGTASKATFATHVGQTISNPPTQAEVQAIDDSLVAISQSLKALLDDLLAHGVLKPE